MRSSPSSGNPVVTLRAVGSQILVPRLIMPTSVILCSLLACSTFKRKSSAGQHFPFPAIIFRPHRNQSSGYSLRFSVDTNAYSYTCRGAPTNAAASPILNLLPQKQPARESHSCSLPQHACLRRTFKREKEQDSGPGRERFSRATCHGEKDRDDHS